MHPTFQQFPSPLLRLLYVTTRVRRGLFWSRRLSGLALEEVLISLDGDDVTVDVTLDELRPHFERLLEQCELSLRELDAIEERLGRMHGLRAAGGRSA